MRSLHCFVVGPPACVDSLFESLATLGPVRVATDTLGLLLITVARPATTPTVSDSDDTHNNGTASFFDKSTIHMCNKLVLKQQTPTTTKGEEHEMRYTFRRCDDNERLKDDARKFYTVKPAERVLLVLYSFEFRSFCTAISFVLKRFLDMADRNGGAVLPHSANLYLVDCSEPNDHVPKQNAVSYRLFSIHMAFSFCAYKMLKWTPKPGTLDTLLSLISDSSHDVPPFHQDNLGSPRFTDLPSESQMVPLPNIPTILNISCADLTTAHMVMQLVHDHCLQFPFFTVSMALRTWLLAKNHTAVGVVCLARTLTDSENINLSDLRLDSVPESLRTLTCRTLDLSSNNIPVIPKWLAERPNVRFGDGDHRSIGQEKRGRVKIDTHKLVIVGDTCVGKTTLLKCMMEGKIKLTSTKHVHTGIAAMHQDVRFKGTNTISWTICDLGGESLTPFHQWFLLSRSVLIVVFDVSKALMMNEPHMAVTRWLNEISVSRSRGARTRRGVIAVGTHMEGIEPNNPKLSELMRNLLVFEDITAFFLHMGSANGWHYNNKSQGMMETYPIVPALLESIRDQVCDDGIPQSIPESWMMLNKQITQSRDKVRTNSMTWTQFVETAKRHGVSTMVEIEKCAEFLADIGTIIHFRYPFWLLSQGHPGAAPDTGLSSLVIVEPRSFLAQLIQEIRRFWHKQHTFDGLIGVPTHPNEAAVQSILVEFGDIHNLLSYSHPSIKEHLSLLPIVAKGAPSSTLEDLRAETSLPIPRQLNGRSIKFPAFTQDLFFKLISGISRHLPWSPKFLWGDAFAVFNACSHPGTPQPDRQVLLLITFSGDTLSICIRSECNEHWTQPQQQSLWGSLMHTIYNLHPSSSSRFEESETPLLPVVELFPCPHCLLAGDSSPEKWAHNGKLSALRPSPFYFTKDDILRAVKNGESQLTCGSGNGKSDLAAVAPNLVALHQDEDEGRGLSELVTLLKEMMLQAHSGSNKKTKTPPSTSMGALSCYNIDIKKGINLGELLSLLIEKGNGTTSILDQVLPISLRLKMLKDVACALNQFHKSTKPPNVHAKISHDSIIVLSMDESQTGPWAQIKDPLVPVTFLSGGYYRMLGTVQTSQCHSELKFCAPEVLSGLKFNPKADVWSFGMITSALLYPLTQPYSHITSNSKYMFTDYDNSSNNERQPHLYPSAIGRDLLRGLITPFPLLHHPAVPTSKTDGGSNRHNRLWRLGNEIVRVCLEPNPRARPAIATLLKVWDYFDAND
ncbi:hypothetical protein Pelo_4187 [Pelomyxa schiedti]|nr:hypothetical protein Pelo_4187 [Pelomyxa schiedti]